MPRQIGYRRRAFCQIIIGGQDVTNILEPFLISVVVIDTEHQDDVCQIELDDRDGKVPIPAPNTDVLVRLGWANTGPRLPGGRAPLEASSRELQWEGGLQRVFLGGVKEVESGFARRGGGRRLWIDASSANHRDRGKQVMQYTWGEGDLRDHLGAGPTGGAVAGGGGGIPLGTVLQGAAQRSGYLLQISPSLRTVTRDFWQQTESFHQFGSRLARELGGFFTVRGNTAYFTSQNDGLDVLGNAMDTITADWGFNLLAWRIKPWTTRPDYAQTGNQWFNVATGAFEQVTGSVQGGGPFQGSAAQLFLPNAAPNRAVAEQRNTGSAEDVRANRGTGWCTIHGEPEAQAMKPLTITGARSGVDGSYRIREAEHHYTRGGGYVTRCVLANPSFNSGYQNLEPVRPPASVDPDTNRALGGT